MALASNTRRLLEQEKVLDSGESTHIEYHLLSWRELYDKSIITADRYSSGEDQENRKECRMSQIVSFSGLVITFVLAYGCDRWVESLRAEMTGTFNISSFLWQTGVANLLLAIALLLLTWYVIFWVNRSKLVSAVFLLVGLAVTFATAMEMSFASTLPPLGIVEFLTPNSHVVYVAAFIAALGLAGLVLPMRAASKKIV